MSRDRCPITAAARVLALAEPLGCCGLIGKPQNKSAELSEWFTMNRPFFRDGHDLPRGLSTEWAEGGDKG